MTTIFTFLDFVLISIVLVIMFQTLQQFASESLAGLNVNRGSSWFSTGLGCDAPLPGPCRLTIQIQIR